ncbi:WD repeat-containing protein ATCSA-1-like [Wolffia australiana]
MLGDVKGREQGWICPIAFRRRVCRRQIAALDISNQKEIVSAHRGGINSLNVDLTEGRYLLAGASDGSAAVYDIQCSTESEGGGRIGKHKSLFVVDKQHAHGHKFSVSSVSWYPVDTGLFITGSFDHRIKVWDTNAVKAVMDFNMPGKVYRAAMSSVATTHMLIAAGTEDVQVRLCDIASGAFTHTLSGHRDGIMAVEWSSSSDWILMTGGCDGAVRFWDIRRAGCFLVLDQSCSQLGSRPPLSGAPSNERETFPRASDSTDGKINHHLGTKKLPNYQKGRTFKGMGTTQRLHPGLTSSRNKSTAHYGAVTALRATKDGMHLLSTGSDSRLKLWDIESGCNTLVNFEASRLQTSRPLEMAVAEDSSLVFVPCATTVKAFDMWSGTTSRTFRGHLESVNCCFFNAQHQELYSGSNDRQIVVWAPTNRTDSAEDQEAARGLEEHDADQDHWSD